MTYTSGKSAGIWTSGLLYQVRPQARYARRAQAKLPKLPERVPKLGKRWMERERRSITQEAEVLAYRQEAKRTEPERKTQGTRKLGKWREREQTHMTRIQPERTETKSQSYGYGGGRTR